MRNNNNVRKKPSFRNPGGGKKPKFDPFFNSDAHSQSRKRKNVKDDFIDSEDSADEAASVSDGGGGGSGAEDDEFAAETAEELRLRLAKEGLERIRAITKREEEERESDEGESDDEERRGRRDSVVAEFLQREQLHDSGRLRRSIASRVQPPESVDGFRMLRKHQQPVTAVALSEDDTKGFSASKDGVILQWDVSSGKSEKYMWPTMEKLLSQGAGNPQSRVKWNRHVLALAVSSDGRYLATGGLDRHVHLWDTRSREHIQAFFGHRGAVSCLVFRQGTSELISGSFDRTIKLWNVEDRVYLDTLFGHQSEILSIDCLQKERLLTVGRDRTMRHWKVTEGSQLVLRCASNLESCCFINNEEFLSGTDDGSVVLWSIMRKKPAFIVKNAHVVMSKSSHHTSRVKENGELSGMDRTENGSSVVDKCSSAQSWVGAVAVCRGSDLAASGAANGLVRLWAIESSTKSIQPLYNLPLVGFINSLAFANSGRFLVAGVGQEPRLGRWGHERSGRNGVVLQSLKLSGG